MLTKLPETWLARVVRVLDASVTPHGIDRYVELVRPTWSSTEVRGRIVEVLRQTPSTVTISIEANRNWRGFEPGQYTELSVEIDGVRHTRCYSMANAASGAGRRLELTVKAQPEGVVSNFLFAQARPGLVVGLSQARGEFTLPEGPPGHLVLVSGGSGITPVLSMLRTLLAKGHRGTITFAHYARCANEMSYAAELEQLAAAHANLRLVRIFTEEPGTGDLDGFCDLAQLDAIDPEWRQAQTYLCGPAPLMEAVAELFASANLSERLHTEAFTLANWVAEAGEVGGTVQFTGSGTTVVSDGRTLLDQAEGAGLRPTSGCRMGICHTCVRPLAAGTVRNVTTGELSSAGCGNVRICVNAPVGDVAIDL